LEPAAAETLRRRIGRLTVVSRSAFPDVECDRFGSDFREVGRLVGRFLLTEGAASSMYIDLPGEGRAARRSGCEEVLGASGVDPDAVIVSVESADDLESVVAARAERVKAIAVSNDCAAVTVMLALSRLGRAPGRDVSVLGQGNYPFARRIRPALSTIDPCGYDVGRRAMEALMQRLSKQRMSAPEETLIAPRVVARDTARVGF
ncbi:MAG: LacI family transcriptional regulator, partial [Planctomycetota bacterium]